MNRYLVGFQETGQKLNGEGRWLHLHHDRDYIKKKIEIIIAEGLIRESENISSEKDRILKNIARLEAQLKELDNSTPKQKFLNERELIAYEKLGYQVTEYPSKK